MARIGPSVWTPTPVPLPAAHPLVTTNAGRANIKKLTGSGLASALLTEDGQLYTWGTSKRGQLGHADASTQEAVPRLIQATPTRLHSDEARKHAEVVVDVALGWGHGLALTSSHRVMAWGWGEQGQLGLGTYENVFTGPLEVEELSDKGIVSIATGPDCSLAVTEYGEVYLWGRNEYYLGLASSFLPTGEVTGENLPKKIEFPVRTEQGDEVQGKIIKLQAGFGHFLALTDEGKVWAFGLNSYGQLGLGDCENRHNPHFVSSMKDEAIRDISCGRMHSLFLTKQGEVYACGLGKNGRLGTGETEDKCVPCLLPNLHSVQQIACGYDHSLVML
ncbi:putative E3 ubiquitin-protein ligase herc6, variant 2 [Balamuthia mandrillaris]